MFALTETADVYTIGAGGSHTTLVRTGLACRVIRVMAQTATVEARVETGLLRRFLYDPSYTLPDGAQVEIDGERWNPISGTKNNPRGPMGSLHHRSIDIVRAAR